ncbi:MAG: glycosyltransferase family 2 protein [Exilibacterium sp.]
MSRISLAIVVPCFNEQDILPESLSILLQTLNKLINEQYINTDSRLYFVDDGSTDNTWLSLKKAFDEHPGRISIIKLSRNKGHQNALFAGLASTKEDIVVSIDADLQDDVGKIYEMIDAYNTGNDVVYGVRASRNTDTFFKRFSAEGYYYLIRKMGIDIIFNHADFRLMSRRAVNALMEYQESQLFLRGIVREIGFRSVIVEYDRHRRQAGESKYPVRKMLSFAWNGITSFSSKPLRMVTLLGISASCLSMLTLIWVLCIKLFTDSAVPGWTSILLPLLFIGSVQLLSIGVLGEYIAKLYIEVKRRPRYHIDEFYENTSQENSNTT